MQFNYKELVQDPCIQELFAEHEAEGEQGEARGLQKSILNFLQARFPALAATSQAQQAVASIQDLEKLDLLSRHYILP